MLLFRVIGSPFGWEMEHPYLNRVSETKHQPSQKPPPLSTMSHPSLEATNSMVFRLTQEMKDCLKSTSAIGGISDHPGGRWMAYSWQQKNIRPCQGPIHPRSDSSLFQLGPQNMVGSILETLLLLNIHFVLLAVLIPSKRCSNH